MASQLYARYMPAKSTSVSKAISPETSTAKDSSEPGQNSPPVSRKKQKDLTEEEERDGNSGATKSSGDSAQLGSIASKSRGSAKDHEGTKDRIKTKKLKNTDKDSAETASPPKLKKRKVKHVEKGESSRETLDQDDPTRSDKHKSVLSKFEKSLRITEAVRGSQTVDQAQEREKKPTPELHDLAPLPQPEQSPEPEYKATFSALPRWLAHPSTVSSTKRVPFSELQIDEARVQHLTKLGCTEAFAVQAGLIPLILPGQQRHYGDVCVSAATGSGKTLAYILPMVQTLRQSTITNLRGLIVVPTRELVTQVRKVAEECCAGAGLKVGVAVGNQSFADEKKLLIQKGRRYDPKAARKMNEDTVEKIRSGSVGTEEYLNDCINILPEHVPTYEHAVDILICTPGRLVEHMNATKGFHLYDLQWLVIDEADRLLDQSFQGWAETLLRQVDGKKPDELLTAREQLVAGLNMKLHTTRRKLTKVILSATMTKDLNKLSVLNLYNPKLLVIEDGNSSNPLKEQDMDGTESFDIPASLDEYALSVGDGSKKPLYLLQLLQTSIFIDTRAVKPTIKHGNEVKDESSESSSDSESDSSSEASSISDSSSDESDSSLDSESEASDMDIDVEEQNKAPHGSRVLIFTNNNENASRLSKVLGLLHPEFQSTIGVLTKSSATSAGRKVLSAFSKGKLSILIASDRASRGLDVPDLTHIVNYDMPRSVVSYVHRVGRTARAGRSGEAWTLFTRSEARWFWNQIAKGHELQRGNKVITRSKIDLSEVSDEVKSRYAAALEALRVAVEGDHTMDG